MSSRNWIGTINNPECWVGYYIEKCKWRILAYCGQEEIGEKEGTHHIQLFIQFDRVRTLEQMKKWVEKAHWERAVDPVAAWNYCCKAETAIEGSLLKSHAECPAGSGRRNDLAAAADLVRTNGLAAVAQEMPEHFIRYHRGLRELTRISIPKRTWKTEVHVRWGRAGVGKTRYVWEKFGYNVCSIEPNEKWFDPYSGEEIVLLDEFIGQIPFRLMLKLCDRYPMQVEVKGGHVQWAPRQIWITSDRHPENWYLYHEGEYEQLARRISSVTEVTEVTEVAG